jgi:chitin synthase
MYNEESHEMNDTLQAVCDNLEYMQTQIKPGSRPIWQQASIIIVSDGRTKMNKGTKQWMTEHGMFDEDAMTVYEQGLPSQPQMHVFENTSQLENRNQGGGGFMSSMFQTNKEFRDPLQIVFGLKENNGGKQHSQLWFFYAFCTQLNPKYCVLIDVGTKAAQSSIWRLLRSMDENPNCAGVCGEIAVENPFGAAMWCGAGCTVCDQQSLVTAAQVCS